MSNQVTTQSTALIDVEALQQVLLGGDLAKLTSAQKIQYYNSVCEIVGLNKFTKPFDYIKLNGKEVLYANKGCAEQLRSVHHISVKIVAREKIDDVYVVTAEATSAAGRSDSSTGVVAIGNLKGEALANALMKAETKAKRRVTLSICGLNMLDETEVDSIPGAVKPTPTEVKAEVAQVPGTFAAETATSIKSPDASPPMSRAELGKAILEVAARIKLPKAEMIAWIQDEFKKGLKDLTDKEMSKFLEMLLLEEGRSKGA